MLSTRNAKCFVRLHRECCEFKYTSSITTSRATSSICRCSHRRMQLPLHLAIAIATVTHFDRSLMTFFDGLTSAIAFVPGVRDVPFFALVFLPALDRAVRVLSSDARSRTRPPNCESAESEPALREESCKSHPGCRPLRRNLGTEPLENLSRD